MASSNPLDQLVKGAPSPNTTLSSVAAAAASPSAPSHALAAEIHESKKPSLNLAPTSEDDPVALLPSSPPQIYLNLLILEASLRSQYLTLRARRRQHTFFLTLLAAWNFYFFYALFLRPREDGKGMGGSVYWVVDMGEKVAFMGGLLTVLLIWGTGQFERGVRWPRRWVGVTNRGLRGMNLKIVILRGSWWARFVELLSLLFPYASIFGRTQGSEFRVVEFPAEKRPSSSGGGGGGNGVETHRHANRVREEDVAPGGDAIKLLLLPKHFSPEFRDNWELYRTEYWERENERRAGLRKLVKTREREVAIAQGGWLWWTGWRGWNPKKPAELDRLAHAHHTHGSLRPPKETRRRGPGGSLQGDSHSRSSSRSSTATPDVDDQRVASRGHRQYRSSNLSTSALSSSASSRQPRAATRLAQTPGDSVDNAHSRDPSTSKTHGQRTLHKRASTVSNASSSSAYDSEISERSTTSATSVGMGTARTRQRDLLMSGVEGDDV